MKLEVKKNLKIKQVPLKKILDGKAYEKIMSRHFESGESFELERIIET